MRKDFDDNIRKYCFDYCRLGNFKDNLVEKLGKKFGVTDQTIRSYVEKYINSLEEEERAYYLEMWNASDDTISLYYKLGLSLENTTKISRERYLQEYFYDLGESVNRDMEKIRELADKLGIKLHLIVKYYNGCVDFYENRAEIKYGKRIFPKLDYWGFNNHIHNTLYKVLTTDDEKEIINVLDNASLSISELSQAVRIFMGVYNKELTPEIRVAGYCDGIISIDGRVSSETYAERVAFLEKKEDELRKKLKWYARYKSEQRKLEREKHKDILKDILDIYQFEDAKKLIEDYLENNGNNSIDFYCKTVGIDKDEFNKDVEMIKEYSPELYERYFDKSQNIKANRYMALLANIKKLVDYIKNGIEEDGQRREFDVLDYYKVTKFSFDDLIKFINNNNERLELSNEDMRTLRIFIAKNKKFKAYTSRNKEVFVNSTIVMKAKTSDGEVLKEFTKDELQAVIDYLEINKLPVNDKTTNLVCKRYASGKLDIFATNSKKKR